MENSYYFTEALAAFPHLSRLGRKPLKPKPPNHQSKAKQSKAKQPASRSLSSGSWILENDSSRPWARLALERYVSYVRYVSMHAIACLYSKKLKTTQTRTGARARNHPRAQERKAVQHAKPHQQAKGEVLKHLGQPTLRSPKHLCQKTASAAETSSWPKKLPILLLSAPCQGQPWNVLLSNMFQLFH